MAKTLSDLRLRLDELGRQFDPDCPKQRDEIAAYNAWLEEKCGKIRAEYMDITAGLTDEQGWMPKEITADNDSHLNADGFDIFVRNLLDYAQAWYEQGLWVPDPALMKEGETPQ